MNRKLIELLILSLLLNSCSHTDETRPEGPQPSSTRYITLSDTLKGTPLKECLADIHFIPLATADSCLIASIDKVIYADGRYYLLDRTYSSLKVFDSTGKYLRAIGRLGQDRDAFTTLKDFTLQQPDKRLLLLCNDKKAILSFTTEGQFLASRKNNLFATAFANMDGNEYYFINQNESQLSGQYNLVGLDKTGEVRTRQFPYSNQFRAEISFSGFLIKNDSGLLYSSPFSDTAWQLTGSRIYPRYIFNFGHLRMPDSVRNYYVRFVRQGAGYAYLGNNVTDNGEDLCFSWFERNQSGFGIYHKNSGTLYNINAGSGQLARLLSAPVGLGDSTTFISWIAASQLLDQWEQNKALQQEVKTDYPDLYKRIAQMQKTDNPILVTYRIRVREGQKL